MFLKTVSRQRKKHNKKIKERNEKNEKHNKKIKEKRKQKNNLKQSSFIEKIFAISKKKHIHTERENSEKRETWKHTEIIKNRKSRNKEEIFSDVNFNSKKIQKKRYTKK